MNGIRYLNVLGLIFMMTMNVLAVFLPLGGKTTGELSDLYPNLFVPAGFTFAIWSLIYILLITLVLYLWSSHGSTSLSKVGPWLVLNMLCNGLWIVAWHYEQVIISLLIMLALLTTLLLMYTRLDIRYDEYQRKTWLAYVPVSVYLGWISVATIANFTTVLVHYNMEISPAADDVVASIMVGIAVVLGLTMLYRRKDIFYAGVIAWACYGILQKRTTDSVMLDKYTEHFSQVGLYVTVIGIVLTIVLGIVRRNPTLKS